MTRRRSWAAELQAWTIYRYLHGHCRVPIRYVVPDSELWPAALRGMALGKLTTTARKDATMYAPDRFAQLDAIGFEWSPPPRYMHRSVVFVDGAYSVRHVPLPALVRALVAFRQHHGHLCVPDAFVVPDNDAAWPHAASNVLLVRAVQTLYAHFYELSDADVTTLHGLSLCHELPHWEDTKQLLAFYVKITGQRAVPIEFVVPAAAPWPPRFHHVCLGELVWYLGGKRLVLRPAKLTQLDALGVVFQTPATWTSIVCGLRTYVAKCGTAAVPSDFAVPDDWEEPLRGLRLGHYVAKLRVALTQLRLSKETFMALSTLLELPPGATPALLRYEPRPLSPSRKHWRVDHRGIDDKKVDALILYRRLHGDLAIPRDFVVDFLDDRWPAPLGGWALGVYAVSLRHRRHLLPPEKLASLDALGFLWQLKPGAISVTTSLSPKVAPFSVLIAALQTYKAETGHLDVPPGYAVPLGAPWPSDAAGIYLKPVLTLLRHHFYDLSATEADLLHELGHCLELASWPALLQLLRRFKTEFGHGAIGLDFCVPSTSVWPTKWHKWPLGEVAYRVGLSMASLDAEKAQQLADSGYLFNSPATWVRIVDGLRQYHRLHGLIDVPPTFVVPNDPAWPQDLCGLRLGRLYRSYTQAVAVQMLPPAAQLDVSGIATVAPSVHTVALWSAIVDALSTFYSIYGHVDVPRAFSVPTTLPWRSCSHGLQLGTVVHFFRTHPSIDAQFKATLDALRFTWCEPPPTRAEVPNDSTGANDVAQRPPSAPVLVDDRPVDVAPKEPESTSPMHGLDGPTSKGALDVNTFADKLEALSWFRAEHGHLAVPKCFVVPAHYPAHLVGMCLGAIVAALRAATDALPPDAEAALDAIGFPWHATSSVLRCFLRYPGETTMVTRVLPLQTVFHALVAFRQRYGPVAIPAGFVVPADHDLWPATAHHMVLPCIVAALRVVFYELTDVEVTRVRTLDVTPDMPDFDVVVALLRIYRIAFGTGAVARDFCVPLVGGEWPSAWRGLALGDLAWRIGLRAWTLDKRKAAQLHDAGFVFNTAETWARIVTGLQSYHDHFGSTVVPPTYVVPRNSSWPPYLHDMALGHWAGILISARELRLLPHVTLAAVDALIEVADKEDAPLSSSPATPTNGDRAASWSPVSLPFVSPEYSPVAAVSPVVQVLDDSSADDRDDGGPSTGQDDQYQCLTTAPSVDCLADHADWVNFTRALQTLFRDHGQVDVPFDYVTDDLVPLGHLVQQLRNGHVVVSRPRKADLDQLRLPSF